MGLSAAPLLTWGCFHVRSGPVCLSQPWKQSWGVSGLVGWRVFAGMEWRMKV